MSSYKDEAILKESIFIIGKVHSVDGRTVTVSVNKDKNLSHISYKGQTVKNVSVGSYIKITKGFIEIVGKVESEFVQKDIVETKDYGSPQTQIKRYLRVSLFGHFEGEQFRQGIKEMPLIDNECFVLDKEEFVCLHQFYSRNDKTIKIGHLSDEPSQIIELSVRKLFASHIGIFGNTGSGKSNTVAKIYYELFRQNEENTNFKSKSKFVLIDFNGEYAGESIISADKEVFNLKTRSESSNKYKVLRKNIEDGDLIPVLLQATEKTQKPFLDRALSNDYLDDEERFQERAIENIEKAVKGILQKVDTNWIPILTELFLHLRKLDSSDSEIAKVIYNKLVNGELKHFSNSCYYIGERHSEDGDTRIYTNDNLNQVYNEIFTNIDQIVVGDIESDQFILDKIKFKILSQYFHEIINGYSSQEHIRPLMGRMFSKFNSLSNTIEVCEDDYEEESNFHVINLKEVNMEMKKTLPLLIVKQLYERHKEADNFEETSLHIIIDEAHNILSANSERENETWKDYRLETFEEIIKEGRKFSTFLTLASQRPFDISPTIISQLHNYFIHKLINEHDIKAVEKAVAYLDKLSFESISILSIGSCFVAGLASDIAVKVDIDKLPVDLRPKSMTINLDTIWDN